MYAMLHAARLQDATVQRREGETEEAHLYRVAHNLYVKFGRSQKRTLTILTSLRDT